MKSTLAVWTTFALLGVSLAAHGPARARGTLVWVDLPGARADRIEELCFAGAPLHWFRATLEKQGLRRLDPEGCAALAALRDAVRRLPARTVDLGCDGPPAAGPLILRIAPSLREATEWLDASGGPSVDLAAACQGDLDWQVLRRIAGLDLELRWEEVDEFISLSPSQNRALRTMPPAEDHPLWRLSRAFTGDKVYANAGLFYGRVAKAERVGLAMDLARAYEEEVLPWTEAELARLEEGGAGGEPGSERRFFLRRVRSSASRVYGRLDRVFQSVEAEWGGRALLVVDASRSLDPFVAVRGLPEPAQGEPAAEALRGRLEAAGWKPGEQP